MLKYEYLKIESKCMYSMFGCICVLLIIVHNEEMLSQWPDSSSAVFTWFLHHSVDLAINHSR